MANTANIVSLVEGGVTKYQFSLTVGEEHIEAGKIDLTSLVQGMDGKINETKTLEILTEALRRSATVVWAETSSPAHDKYEPGEKVTWTVTVTNTGNQTIKEGALVISDATVVSGTGYTFSGGNVTLNDLAPEASCVINVEFDNVTYGGSVQPSATLTATELTQTGNAELVTFAAQPEISVMLSALPTSAFAGQTVVFTAVASNTAEDTVARNAEIEIELPDVFADLVTGNVSGGTAQVSGTTATVTIGDLAYDDDQTITVTGTVKSDAALGQKQAEATLTADNCTESTDTTQVTITDSVSVNVAFTSTPHESHSDRYVEGDTITGTVTIGNASGSELAGLTVTTLSGGDDVLGGKATDSITLPTDGKVYSFSHVVTHEEAVAGTYTVTVQVTGDNIDKQGTASVTVAEGVYSVSIAMLRTDSNDPAKLGDVVTGTITVTNDGTYDLTDLTVTVTPADTELTVE